MFKGKNIYGAHEYISYRHTSNCTARVVEILNKVLKQSDYEERATRLGVVLSILEPLIINDQNLEIAVEKGLVLILIDLIALPEYVLSANPDAAYKIKLPVFIKYACRCMTSCVRN